MSRAYTKSLVLLSFFMLAPCPSRAQSTVSSGFYQITTGEYSECCGFIGVPTRGPVPDDRQAFVELTVDPTKNLAQMRFLGPDMATVFRTYSAGLPVFFSFSNGVVYADHIQFGTEPYPEDGLIPPYYYIVNFSGDTLRIHGEANADCPGCADIPGHFVHTNVVAVLMPTTTLRFSEVEFCWKSATNRTYQVQYQSTSTTNIWTNLGPPVAGNGTTNCITDPVAPGQSHRLFRVLTLP